MNIKRLAVSLSVLPILLTLTGFGFTPAAEAQSGSRICGAGDEVDDEHFFEVGKNDVCAFVGHTKWVCEDYTERIWGVQGDVCNLMKRGNSIVQNSATPNSFTIEQIEASI